MSNTTVGNTTHVGRGARTALLAEFVKRQVTERYKGSFLGIAWTVLSPLFMLVIYTVVFSVLLRVGSRGEGHVHYGLMIFAGLVPWTAFAEGLSLSTACIVGNANLVKRVVFPTEILPVSAALSSLVHGSVGVAVLLVFAGLMQKTVHLSVVFLPVIFAVMLLFLLGPAYFLAAAAALVRDIRPMVPVVLRAWLFLTPIVYTLEHLPEKYRGLMLLNPMAVIVVSCRRAVLDGEGVLWRELAILAGVSVVLLLLGRLWFNRQRRYFPEVL